MSEADVSEETQAARKQRLDALASWDIEAIADGKAQTRFSQDRRYVQAGHGRYDSLDALTAQLSKTFPSERSRFGLHGALTRVGKYTRVTEDGDTAFTFGDPILDFITDAQGNLRIGADDSRPFAAEIAAPDRGGGISAINIGGDIDQARAAIRAARLAGETRYAVVEDEGDALTLASRNPHEQWFYRGSSRMRFRAFKKSYIVYKKMGADIETWGHDFRRASISSVYGSFVTGLSQCFPVHYDSDSDTNDDYVDEYEWFLGGGVESGFDGVRSSCVATWHDRIYTGTVEYGCVIADV